MDRSTLRILQVHTRYRQGGGEDSVVAVERRLLERAGHEIETHIEDNPETVTDSLLGLAASPWNFRAAGRVLRSAEQFQPDVVHVHNTWFRLSPAAVRVVHHAGFPTVVTMHNYRLACLNAQLYRDGKPCEDCVGRVPWRGVTRRCYRDSAVQSAVVGTTVMLHRSTGTWESRADVVIALTDFAAERLVASGVPYERIAVKGNMVEDPGARAAPPSASQYLLFAGRLSEEKGILDLVEAWRSMPVPGLELWMAGDGPLVGLLESSLPSGVKLMGRVPTEQIREMLLGARALIFPSRWFEGLPMIVVEAMSAGMPIVYPDLGAIPDVVGPGGWSFEALNPRSLALQMASLLDSAAVDQRGATARRQYEDRFSPDVGLSQLEEVYERAIRDHARNRADQT